MSDFVSLEGLTLAYGSTIAVDKLNLTIAQGELVSLLGPSGCGKTTTMRAIAGLMSPRAGRITIDGRDVTRLPPSKRDIGLVFQSYALFPHLTVYENVAFGLRLRSESDLDAKVRSGLATVGLEAFADRAPKDLSGGQQQRVALARSLVMQPKVLLLDEPLSNLDARLRLDMRMELQRVQRETGITMIFVTHDQSEALALSDRIVLMKGGAIEQLGTPEEIYSAPVSGFAADFVGFETILPDEAGGGLAWRPGAVVLGTGPHQGTVIGTAFAGERREYVLGSALGQIKADAPVSAAPLRMGETIAFDLPPERAVRLERLN
ncbi:ABC transporter ATP-binding protein [Salipiger sp. 1_MG-2023]|uniref:ABC transporter ATP-binding protein n=1 Tax=Salipiger sp. 1_MG-2023 TaxID=3062665 RepID=UPI0026E4370E|nr:ABC transporter ATP-binding protein [Salipiger sp. 1_MG-2023]MDO6586082.1 ABC transporter ATP-binding protein [Salipiger sp. 1_MG-2023]